MFAKLRSHEYITLSTQITGRHCDLFLLFNGIYIKTKILNKSTFKKKFWFPNSSHFILIFTSPNPWKSSQNTLKQIISMGTIQPEKHPLKPFFQWENISTYLTLVQWNQIDWKSLLLGWIVYFNFPILCFLGILTFSLEVWYGTKTTSAQAFPCRHVGTWKSQLAVLGGSGTVTPYFSWVPAVWYSFHLIQII